MENGTLLELVTLGQAPGALEATVSYLAQKLSFLRRREKVLICFERLAPDSLGSLLEQAVLRCGAAPVFWEKDWRWKSLLRIAFASRASTMIAPPLVALGLAKIIRYNATPLYIRRVVTAGYPCLKWMAEGISHGFDCRTQGIFTPGGRLIGGFSCEAGVHVREEIYGVDVVDAQGNLVPEGTMGEMVLYSKQFPHLRYPMGENARMLTAPCACGCTAPILTDICPGRSTDPDLAPIGQFLQSWSSILDCRMIKGAYGLELELITFPGEKLPQLPSAAKRIIRPWQPDIDEPFYYVPGIENH